MKKLISIGIVLALLVTFVVPATVGADECCVDDPCPAAVPDPQTNTLGGALVWTILGVQYIMGRAVGDTTAHIAGTLGAFSDDLATPLFKGVSVIADGVGGLLSGLGDMIGMPDIINPIADILTGLADVIEDMLS